ncbi:MAG: 3-deoxy-7-phosphoheptulonate synthase [Oscillospiraceae bacterium]|jgi:3-deoxy-7-phosphoheptulonate synthase|nr:3-deoxy-7-phosphoheptulonate synthase [Oscillospiraceae bacterium]
MIIICKKSAKEAEIQDLLEILSQKGVEPHPIYGETETIVGLVGDTSKILAEDIEAIDIVKNVKRVSEPFKLANIKFHPNQTVVDAGGVKIGGGNFAVMAGPCSVESEEQIVETAKKIKASGGNFLRGGAFKPRTSPYAFRGLKAEGLRLLELAKKETGLPIVTELMAIEHLQYFDNVDVIQIGARNMQNFELLTELGKCNKPILLKRGLANTIEEWLMSAEYIMASGNTDVILCERGIRTFETALRNTYDLSCIPLLRKMTHLPVIGDPSHATGKAAMVHSLSKATVAVGADGLMIEVHPNPQKALSDGAQSITPEAFDYVMKDVKKYCILEGKLL